MKKRIIIINFMFVLLLTGCSNATAQSTSIALQKRITASDFVQLYKDYLVNASSSTANVDGTSPEFFDITPDKIFEKAGCQIFKENTNYESFLVKDGVLTSIGLGFGGFGITDIHACDFDENGKPDIIYTHSWGSGLHRSVISIYNLTENKETTLDYANLNNDMLLVEDNDTFNVYEATLGSASSGNIVDNMVKGKLIGTITVKDGTPIFNQSV